MSVSAERIAAQNEVLGIHMSLAIEAAKRPPAPEKMDELSERVKELADKVKSLNKSGGTSVDLYA